MMLDDVPPRRTVLQAGDAIPGDMLHSLTGSGNDAYAASAPAPARPQAIRSSAFDDVPGRFLACLPRRK